MPNKSRHVTIASDLGASIWGVIFLLDWHDKPAPQTFYATVKRGMG